MTTNNDIFPIEFKTILDSLDYQENGELVITSLNYHGDDLTVFFSLIFDDNQKPRQLWRLDIIGIEKEKVVRSCTSLPEIYSDHFLLYEFVDNYVELYFNGKADNSEKLLVDLYKSHITSYNNDLAFGYGINAPNGMLQLCSNDSGLFARGPKRILERYEKCLMENDIKTNYINEIDSANKELKLLIFGDSYFIGKDFKFNLVENDINETM